MQIKFHKFINENIINNIQVNYIYDIPAKTLIDYLTTGGINSDDINTFCKYNDNVSVFKLKVSWNLSLDLIDILEKGGLNANILHNNFYWIDMGNGLTSIAEESELPRNYNATLYTIWSGEKTLNKFLEEDLELLFNSEKYNL